MKLCLLSRIAVTNCAVLVLVSCAALKSAAPGAGQIAKCILEHDSEIPEQIASDCSGVALVEVIGIVAASKAREVRRVSRLHTPSRDGGSDADAALADR